MTVKPNAPASERNKWPILDVIQVEFRDCTKILEIGTGSGQHAVFFAKAMPWLTWQTSDLAENHEGIQSWIADAQLPNVRTPILLDVQQADGVEGPYDGVFSANTAHIMSETAVRCMFEFVGRVLARDAVFCLYGPFRQRGEYSTESNKRFDQTLRGQDPSMGLRDLEDLDEFAADSSMYRERHYAMPANNLLVVWRKNLNQEEK